MANLEFYSSRYGIHSEQAAFEKFVGCIQNYYNAAYYVDWAKTLTNAGRFDAELALLSTLCRKPNRVAAARELLLRFPQVIPVLPILVACRGAVALVDDVETARVTTYDFQLPQPAPQEHEVEKYVRFLVASGLIDLLDHVGSVKDYVVGIEVGMDTNARKNRGGTCGVLAISPWIQSALAACPEIQGEAEVSSERLRERGCRMPDSTNGLIWDFAFWTRDEKSPRFVVMEINHYGSSGSKPPAIAREYTSRDMDLSKNGVGFIWVTDGMGWHDMLNPLRTAFHSIDWLVNVRLASEGMVLHALRTMLLGSEQRRD
jgi:type II restriction enzyme